MRVTSVPKERKMEANSTPTAPAPTITSDLGISGSERISILVRTRSLGSSFRTGAEDYVPGFDRRGFTIGSDFDGQHPVLRRASQLTVAANRFHLVLLHEEIEALGVLGHDFRLACLHGRPIQPGSVHAFDAEFFGVFEMVPNFGVEEQGFGRDAAYMEAGASEHAVLLDEGGFQAILTGADCGRVARRTTADDSDVINGFGQVGSSL
jgi:hypothetical protein